MAKAQGGIDLSCEICMEIFVDPRSLPCGHTVCHSCLEKHISKSITGSKFHCPFCRKAIKVVKTTQKLSFADQFPINYFVVQTMEQIDKLRIQTAKSQLETAYGELKMTYELAEQKMEQRHIDILSSLNLRVEHNAAEIDKMADELIDQISTSIRTIQKQKHCQLGLYHQFVVKQIQQHYENTKTMFVEPKKCLESNKKLLAEKSLSDTDIEQTREQMEQVKITLTNYLSTPVSEGFLGHDKADALDTLRITQPRGSNDGELELVKIVDRPMEKIKYISVVCSLAVIEVDGSTVIIIADYSNGCVKSYNYDSCTLKSVYETSGPPCGLAALSDSEVVLTLPWSQQIVYLRVNLDISLINTVEMEKSYYYITKLPNVCLAASVWNIRIGCVDIIDSECRVIHSISNLSPGPSYLTALGAYLLVVSANSVTCVDMLGHVKWVVSHKTRSRSDVCGVTCDESGFIYVADNANHSVFQISPQGHIMGDVITKEKGLHYPKAVCFHKDKLYVSQFKGEIKIYAWQ